MVGKAGDGSRVAPNIPEEPQAPAAKVPPPEAEQPLIDLGPPEPVQPDPTPDDNAPAQSSEPQASEVDDKKARDLQLILCKF